MKKGYSNNKKKLYLVRHAESYSNIEDIYEYDAALTEVGVIQSAKIAQYFKDDIKLIIYSELQRTKQTAKFTINKYPDADVQQWDVQEFNYLGENYFTKIEKLTRISYKQIFWEQIDLLYKYNDDAESFFEFLKRVESFVTKIMDTSVDSIIVFSHKYFIKGVLWFVLMHLNEKKYYSLVDFKKFCESCAIENATIISCLIDKKEFRFLKTIIT